MPLDYKTFIKNVQKKLREGLMKGLLARYAEQRS